MECRSFRQILNYILVVFEIRNYLNLCSLMVSFRTPFFKKKKKTFTNKE